MPCTFDAGKALTSPKRTPSLLSGLCHVRLLTYLCVWSLRWARGYGHSIPEWEELQAGMGVCPFSEWIAQIEAFLCSRNVDFEANHFIS